MNLWYFICQLNIFEGGVIIVLLKISVIDCPLATRQNNRNYSRPCYTPSVSPRKAQHGLPVPPSSPVKPDMGGRAESKNPGRTTGLSFAPTPSKCNTFTYTRSPTLSSRKILSKSGNAGARGNCSGLLRSARGIPCATNKIRGVGLACRSDPSVAHFLPIQGLYSATS